MTPTEKQKLQQSHLKQRRERARSTSAVPMHDHQMFGVKRRKQDHNRYKFSRLQQKNKKIIQSILHQHILKTSQFSRTSCNQSSFYCRNNYTKESDSSSDSNPEDHIYEEIDSDSFTTQDEEDVEDNFLLSISLERQRNLKFYGSAGWDFGNVS